MCECVRCVESVCEVCDGGVCVRAREQENGARLLRVELAKNVLGQLLVALAQLQERGVMHR